MVKKRKSVLKSSTQVVDSPMKEPRIISNYKNYIYYNYNKLHIINIPVIKLYLIKICQYFRR